MLTFAAGVGTAYAYRRAFVLDVGSLWKGNGFLAFMIYVAMVIVPASIYFYAFHGDWFLSYFSGAGPSAWGGLFMVLLLLGTGAGGYAFGRHYCRRDRLRVCAQAIAGCAFSAFVGCLVFFSRVMNVGTYRQYHGEFGLTPLFQSATFAACVLMGGVLIGGLVYTIRQVKELSLGHV